MKARWQISQSAVSSSKSFSATRCMRREEEGSLRATQKEVRKSGKCPSCKLDSASCIRKAFLKYKRAYKCMRVQRRLFLRAARAACESNSQQRALWHWQTASQRGNRRLWLYEKLITQVGLEIYNKKKVIFFHRCAILFHSNRIWKEGRGN